MAIVYVILLLFLLVLTILIDRLWGRSYLSNLAIRIRDFFKPPQASTGITVIDQTGAEISVLAHNPLAKRSRRQRLRHPLVRQVRPAPSPCRMARWRPRLCRGRSRRR